VFLFRQERLAKFHFFNAYIEAFQTAALKELGAEARQRLKEINCALSP